MHAETFLREFAPLASGPGGVQKLRELVLQLAVRGKLVPQIAGDGDAEDLLSKLQKRFRQENKKTEYPTTKPLFSTPRTWRWTTMSGVGRIVGGGTPKSNVSSYFSEPGVPWLTPADLYGFHEKFITRGKRSISELGLAESSARLLPKDSVLFSSRAPIGYSAIAGNPLATNQGFKSCVPYVDGISEYILIYLRASIKEFEARASGTTFKEVSGKVISAVPIPLPPLAEQKRIVAKVDELMALCDALEARQAEETGLKRAAAASALHHLTGAKTPEETADRWSVLLPRFGDLFDDLEAVKELRGAVLGMAISGLFRCSGAMGSIDEKPEIHFIDTRTNEPIEINRKAATDEHPFSIPRHWQWWQLADLTNSSKPISYGVIKLGNDTRGGIPTLRCSDVKYRRIDLSSVKSIDPKIEQQYLRTRLLGGEILVNIRGTLGGCAIVPKSIAGHNVAREVAVVDPNSAISPDFLLAVFSSPYFQNRVTSNLKGIAYKGLNLGTLASFPIPLPPSDEQKLIVAKVDKLMALCDRLEEQVREGERLNAELMASLIHAITETDPDGGSALEPAGSTDDTPAIAESKMITGNSDQILETKSAQPVVPAKPESRSSPQRAPNVDTKFQEAVLVAAIVRTFFQDGGEPIGNFRLQKAVYFARRKMGEDVGEMAYLKKAAGPYNPSMKYSGGIAIAKRKSWLREARGRFGFGHVPGAEVADAAEWIETYGYGEPARWVADHFRYKKNDEWETLATVDYAVEHLRSLDIDPHAEQILQYITSDPEWHPKIEKLRLTEMSVGTAMLEVAALFDPEGEDESV